MSDGLVVGLQDAYNLEMDRYPYIVSISIYRIVSYRPLQYRKFRYIENFDISIFFDISIRNRKSRRNESMDVNGITFPFCSIT